jgi:hypothetical protein
VLSVQLFSVHRSHTGYDSDVFTARKSLPSTVDSGVHWSLVPESLQIGRAGILIIGRLRC